MRVWIDLSNSPHSALFEPVVKRFRDRGWEVLLTARDHAQTLELARGRWPDVEAIGGASPPGRLAKGLTLGRRAASLRKFIRRVRPDVALSHGSYAQVLAARAARIPAVTMMDYEYQPANHLSFRLAYRLLVPQIFPAAALKRFGASEGKVVRYEGFKEELYLAGYKPDERVLEALGVDPERVLAVFRPPPEGALYHGHVNTQFWELLRAASARDDVQAVLLPRTPGHATTAREFPGVVVPPETIDGLALLAAADLTIGGGGTMTRESALLGTPTYTVFSGRLAAVDAELMRRGFLHDLRDPLAVPVFEPKAARGRGVPRERGEAILSVIEGVVEEI